MVETNSNDRLKCGFHSWFLQVDLQEWIKPLNKIDTCLSYYLQRYPTLLLIGPVERTKSRGAVKAPDQLISKPAESLSDVDAVPVEVRTNICILVNFLSGLLLNSTNKAIFNSVEELVDLLAAADDTVASAALEALCNLATAPYLHKQQAPEVQQHSTALHSSKTSSHKRLIALARGWGTRGSGLGLYTCSTADDSEFGQGTLPKEAGELNFTFFRSPTAENAEDKPEDELEVDQMDETYLVKICLHAKEILNDNGSTIEPMTTNDKIDEASQQKRRRVAPATLDESNIKSTAELFFLCLEKAEGRSKIPADRLFPLLADIRLTRSFHCRASRVAAVEQRLRALITILNAHPSPEIMSGYFQAQPELCVELIDLLRPTVSSAAVSAATSGSREEESEFNQDAIAALADSSIVPYGVRRLAVEALTALVSRRDGAGGGLTGVARHSNVLSELGVGKGQYLGLLPTLIRFSLASISTFLSAGQKCETAESLPEMNSDDLISLEIGLAFVGATRPPQIPREQQLEKSLEFIESVLTLAGAVVATPSGTSALTDCGLIPTLLNTVATDADMLEESRLSVSRRIGALLRFVTAQAVQILEGAIVTHNNALSAFHDLNGVEVLTRRLSKEISLFSTGKVDAKAELDSGAIPMDSEPAETDAAGLMEVDSSSTTRIRLQSSHRVLLFSIVTCLTVVFHQESTSSSATTPSGGAELRKPLVTNALIEIIDNVQSYGGNLVSLIATLLSDVMNSDPHVVRHVHDKGLAKSFIKMLVDTKDGEPVLPAVPELIMAVPNVISALALTEDGANAVKEANPFPAILRIFYHSKYAMPQSRCLLNEMTAIVGTGLDEIMRHVTTLRPLVCRGIADAMNEVAEFGESLLNREEAKDNTAPQMEMPASQLENERSCLMQYALNFGQILEQILHTEDHCEPFVVAGGLGALLKLYPYMMPSGSEFLSHISCLSCPSVSTLTHSTTEDSFLLAFKCIALRYNSFKLLQTMINTVNMHLSKLEEYQVEVKKAFPSIKNQESDGLDATCILDGVPLEAIYTISRGTFKRDAKILSSYLRQVVIVQYVTSLLSTAIKAACQRNQDTVTGWSGVEKEWKKELSSTAFEELVARLSQFYQSAIFEVCRVRTQNDFESRETLRLTGVASKKLRYRLRIVCPEGAVVRDGIEIDSCASVGNMEMGEIVDAFDRCVNSSGVLRYRTIRGWVSEQTRGHGREPIAEVLNVWESSSDDYSASCELMKAPKGRVEAGVQDMRSTSANVLARVQTSYSELFSALTRVAMQGVRLLPVRTLSFQPGTIGAHVATMMRILKSEIHKGFNRREVVSAYQHSTGASPPNLINSSGLAMYFGCLLSHLHKCLFEEKRERRMVNVPLLIVLWDVHQSKADSEENPELISFLDAVRFIFNQTLLDFVSRALGNEGEKKDRPRQRLARTTAACFPPACTILRRLLSVSSITASPVASVLNRVKSADLGLLLGENDSSESRKQIISEEETFSPERFARSLLCTISKVLETCVNSKLVHAPPHVAHPMASLVAELMSGLEDATKKGGSLSASAHNTRDESRPWNRGLTSSTRGQGNSLVAQAADDFEPSEETITRLMEMGFSRDHAWDAVDSTSSNRLEVVMEHALSHPPPSPSAIQRRREEREARRQQREETAAAPDQGAESAAGAQETLNEDATDNTAGADTSASMDVDTGTGAGESDETAKVKDESMENAVACLSDWKTTAPDTVCSILGGIQDVGDVCRPDSGKGEGDGEIEALTVVLCSFLLDLCQRYPEEKDKMTRALFAKLKEQLIHKEANASMGCRVKAGREKSFAALCHGAVLFTRALPKARNLLLSEDLIHPIVSCVQGFLKSDEMNANGHGRWPEWLASSLLLLDIMAQPVVAFGADEDTSMENSEGELSVLKSEHKKQAGALASLASDIFSALYSREIVSDKSMEKQPESKERDEPGGSGENESSKEAAEGIPETSGVASVFQSVPSYFPLLPSDCFEPCADICMQILDGGELGHAPPGIIHGTLLLLMRLVRSPKLSTYCLKAGAAEKTLSLPKECRFTGHSGLVTLIMRRLLEDESTLQTAMESEIRGTITKLHHEKESDTSSGKEMLSVPRRAFVQEITPLLCRDPVSFLKAVSTTVRFENGAPDSGDAKVALLSSNDRLKHTKIIGELLKSKEAVAPCQKPSLARRSSSGGRQRRSSHSGSRSKTPSRTSKRGGTPKKSKKEKTDQKERIEEDSKSSTVHSPVSHIVSLLITSIIAQSSKPTNKADLSTGDLGFEKSFLWTANMLEILADLVLAIPACATAIHKFRPPRSKDRQSLFASFTHALDWCPMPPKTFVSYMLHTLLPQDRWSSRKEQHFWNRDSRLDEQSEDLKSKKKAAFRRTKVVQSTARLLISLVARPGEGRRRVISELTFALSGGKLGLPTAIPPQPFKTSPCSKALHALLAWGELCIGLAVPRSSGNNYDGNSIISFEVVKIMLENGMPHALLVAMHMVPLHHPMASNTVGSLILPFEVLSRASVGEAVEGMVEKEQQSKGSKGQNKAAKHTASEEHREQSDENAQRSDAFTERSDAFADDHMLEDAFGMDMARRQGDVHDGMGDGFDDEDDDEDDDVDQMDVDDGIEVGDHSEDDEMSSHEGSEETSDDEDSEDDEEDEGSEEDEDDENEQEEDDSSVSEDEDDQNGDDFEQDFTFSAGDYGEDLLTVENQEFDGEEDNGIERGEGSLDDGWTRIESSGFGGMVLGSRRAVGQAAPGGNVTARTRGFIDAAEAMIGTLLRTGGLQGDALAEIEGSLGIRIMSGGRMQRNPVRMSGRGSLAAEEAFGSRLGGVRSNRSGDSRNLETVGTLPHVHQRSQPDVGYSALGGGGRWNEISSMEYVYGGPSITAGSRNYDLVSPMTAGDEENEVPSMSLLDGRLFPGGPASATHAQTQHSSHPLLCGVDLPPVNSLVSDLLPHGVRATRRGQMTTRSPSDWTSPSFSNGGFLVSTSNGSIVRSNRPNGIGNTLINSRGPGPVGWTDDGLPFDSTVEHFSSAFDHALGEFMTHMTSSEEATGNSARGDAEDNSGGVEPESNEAPESPASNNSTEPTGSADAQESNDGDRVASSLVEGLHLSPLRSEQSTHHLAREDQRVGSDTQMENGREEAVDRSIVEQGAITEQRSNADSSAPPEQVGNGGGEGNEANEDGLVCPPGMDPEVFCVLPPDMQREVVAQARVQADVAQQLDGGSSLDPEALAALPEAMRREVIEQEQRERRLQEAPADPANAEEMDNASFVASLGPDLRNEILMTADDAFLQSLPPDIVAEAQLLRERASSGRRELQSTIGSVRELAEQSYTAARSSQRNGQGSGDRDQAETTGSSSRRRQRAGKIRVECDRDAVVYLPPGGPVRLSTPVASADLKALLRFMYLLSPVRPQRLLQRLFQNLCTTASLRHALSATFVKLLHDDIKGALQSLDSLQKTYKDDIEWRAIIDRQFSDSFKDFPPHYLIGAAPEVLDTDGLSPNITMLRRKQTSDTAASIAANLPMSARGSRHEQYLPPVVATRMVDTLQQMCKASPRFCMDLLIEGVVDAEQGSNSNSTGFEMLLDLLEKPRYSKSSANLEQLLTLLESAVSPLSYLSKHGEEDAEISQRELQAATQAGKEWVDVPRIVVSQDRLQALCSILRMETCRDSAFAKVNTIARRLCRVEANRGYVLAELASVARALGADAIRDLKALGIRMSNAARTQLEAREVRDDENRTGNQAAKPSNMLAGSASNSVAVSTSTSELKLLRVLQTLQALCLDTSEDGPGKKTEGVFVTEELVHLLRAMNLKDLWAELTACLKIVQVLEGVSIEEDADKKTDDNDNIDGDNDNESEGNGKKLQNSVAGLLTRFLPSIEAFFVANASSTRSVEKRKDSNKAESDDSNFSNLVGGQSLIEFVSANKVLLNALVRNNSSLLDKGLRALIAVPRCRVLLDFDVKRHWFKTQVRRLRQQASRRHGSLRLHIRRKHVFEDAYHQLRLRNADEMRGRLHITFRNEDGVDAGGLSREFFGILAKEIFNPNYALFTSTEDGSTFQPNPNSSINPDHLSYFRFVGRIVGKAVSDGYLLDAYFTRSLYKHMLGIKVSAIATGSFVYCRPVVVSHTLALYEQPTHHDMEAIDPDYYKNLKTILEYNLGDLGLDLTFSTEDHFLGRTRMVDLIPNGRNTPVTEENKGTFVSLVCQHRMTTAISSQIKAYLDGFYELVSPDLVQIFSPRELELLISGLPDIDVHDLKKNTEYQGWRAADKQIQWFWNILFSLTRNQKATFLQFVTGSSKVPLAGFGELPGMRGVQKFSIHKAGGSNGALMSAHTCFNSLDLPEYGSEEELREKLLYAINEGGGTFLLA
eukprot:scaffold1525_cov142-Cylindrotheca_fusiformis.AAC.62